MGIMIEDQELRDLFQIESEEHIQVIEKCLLTLEKNPHDYDILHLIFREAHSMKGASRMLGLSDIESIAHIFEEVLGKASRGEFQITPKQIDIYYEGIDAIKKLVNEAVTGENSDVDVVSVLDKLIESKNDISKKTEASKNKASIITVEKKEPEEIKPEVPKQEVKVEPNPIPVVDNIVISEPPPKEQAARSD